MLATITRHKISKRGSKFQWKWCYSVALDGGKPTTIGESLIEAESWAKRRGATQIVRNWMPNLPSRQSTNFKRRGRPAPAGATTTPQPKQTTAARIAFVGVKDKSIVHFPAGDGSYIAIHCAGELHANIVAKAISDGAVRAESFPEECDEALALSGGEAPRYRVTK